MSICSCPNVPKEKQQELVDALLHDSKLESWSLLSLQDLYQAGNTLKDISETIPFRGGPCNRTHRCCGVCTRQCYTRCIQDCLHRIYMWRNLVNTTAKEDLCKIPLSIRYVVNQHFETLEDMSWVVGDILSRTSNAKLKEYMKNAHLRPEENPYKIEYSAMFETDLVTGKRIANPITGELSVLEWPKTGLCPYCLPKVTFDRRFGPKQT